MSVEVLFAAYVNINSVDISAYVSSVEIDATVEDKDSTTFTSGGAHARLGGLKDGSLKLNFFDDYAASGLDSQLWAILGTLVTFEVRKSSGSASTSNPKYTGTVLVNDLKPVQAGVGEIAAQSITWPTSGVITRATS